ncbi:hypothetical protein EV679_0839 [Kerstersia gyiorum]|uniref:Uncharacterized protein n=1 Tax=Kerstersia gyiorum TaxID=206506 RepID=A0A4Q7MX54_9BURK|nr:hypothetical protein EV679_0839 [Kerstersia gyiorum]
MQVSGRQEASLRLGTSLPPTRGLALSHDLVFKTLFTRQLHLLSDLINTVCDRYPQWPLRNMFYLARMLSDQLSAAGNINHLNLLSVSACWYGNLAQYPQTVNVACPRPA